MKLQAITYFNELVRSRSIRQASETLGITPTVLSRQLESLEAYFGAPLVTRGARGIMLTAAGELLASRSRSVMRELETTKQVIDDLKGLKRGRVSLFVNGAAISAILAPALCAFHAQYPGVSIEVEVGAAQEAINAAVHGDADMAITMFSPKDSQLDIGFTLDVLHEVVISPHHPLAQLPLITLDDIRAFPIAMPERMFSIRRQFDLNQRAAGYEPIEATFTTSSLELQKELAIRGAAVLILPAMAVSREVEQGHLVVRPFVEPSQIKTQLQMGMANHSAPSFAAAKLAAFFEAFLSQQSQGF
jgi:DNA-binding transcriptional LysR family regulator